MATREQCPEYENCGFVKYRLQRPDRQMQPLPENGDCGKDVDICGRLNPLFPFKVEAESPENGDEAEIVYPKQSDGHSLTGGTLR